MLHDQGLTEGPQLKPCMCDPWVVALNRRPRMVQITLAYSTLQEAPLGAPSRLQGLTVRRRRAQRGPELPSPAAVLGSFSSSLCMNSRIGAVHSPALTVTVTVTLQPGVLACPSLACPAAANRYRHRAAFLAQQRLPQWQPCHPATRCCPPTPHPHPTCHKCSARKHTSTSSSNPISSCRLTSASSRAWPSACGRTPPTRAPPPSGPPSRASRTRWASGWARHCAAATAGGRRCASTTGLLISGTGKS